MQHYARALDLAFDPVLHPALDPARALNPLLRTFLFTTFLLLLFLHYFSFNTTFLLILLLCFFSFITSFYYFHVQKCLKITAYDFKQANFTQLFLANNNNNKVTSKTSPYCVIAVKKLCF